MAITILPPVPPDSIAPRAIDDEPFDFDSDDDMEDAGRPSVSTRATRHLVTPGELVTNDPQWMR